MRAQRWLERGRAGEEMEPRDCPSVGQAEGDLSRGPPLGQGAEKPSQERGPGRPPGVPQRWGGGCQQAVDAGALGDLGTIVPHSHEGTSAPLLSWGLSPWVCPASMCEPQ